jgi:hypothetical protein
MRSPTLDYRQSACDLLGGFLLRAQTIHSTGAEKDRRDRSCFLPRQIEGRIHGKEQGKAQTDT